MLVFHVSYELACKPDQQPRIAWRPNALGCAVRRKSCACSARGGGLPFIVVLPCLSSGILWQMSGTGASPTDVRLGFIPHGASCCQPTGDPSSRERWNTFKTWR
ncbi:uncharacterized protein PHACADRAFT_258970 [Phanerochaete carnosa HHB-10118-sp]|uniref:Uncharacterized protein n=1 Tax=Phanerochaete carnosa (strain HHB-10118-sp) TaxID=650164 RepID=K5UXN3_PHACS|nr:uncharacterized protein PHACADRAFT_258970 [Phanerochaete carnosa HHB-10118-sp]EKM54836.1 hypothetical protein PHACADRAFT_258970 [Phanerochaete carnosa HHB-10118-sp]